MGKRICELEDFGLNPDEVRGAHPVMSNPETLRPYCVNADEAKPVPIGEIPCDRLKTEAAILRVQSETYGEYNRTQLQKFRDAYRAAWHVAHNPG